MMEGSIPNELTQLTKLEKLVLFGNEKMVGSLPADLANLSLLTKLRVGRSNIGGTIPDAIYGLLDLVELDLADANFTGGLSEDFSNLQALQTLRLNNNTLTGSIPVAFDTLMELSKLQFLIGAERDSNLYQHSLFCF
jgi:Leucine-rich repeat (LRR) protein